MGEILDFTKRKIKRYRKVKSDPDVVEALKELREYVENIGTGKICLINGIYQQQDIQAVQTTKVGIWEFGYQIKPTIDPGIYRRNVFMKIPNQDILSIPERERNPIMAAIFETMVDLGCDFPEFELINFDCIKMSQNFTVMFWHEQNPNIIVPGKKG